ncbi:MAG: UDP-N-acetylmuramoyl-L-alanyl-D-glutamate--2,6-diaminopimelate ligase [Bacillota bacterium]|jgi:UDP-N-acetylmuramoyl-L-alanyl-D-glutamate--2,6-diaminopimelate ligase
MKLGEILAYLGGSVQAVRADDTRLEITGIAYDSRKVMPGYLFVAISGLKVDGHDYIDQAIKKGAAVILLEHPVDSIPHHVPVIISADSRKTMSLLASLWWGLPDRRLRVIGVTGTNGKTTTTKLIKWLLESAGQKSGLIGTINNQSGAKILPSTHTTPESLELFELMSIMEEENCQNVIIEVSSHALKQGRVYGCNFDGVVFTNLTQDHLDYHATWEDYRDSKVELFKMVQKQPDQVKYAVINIDDPAAQSFIEATQVDIWTYGMKEGATLRIKDYHFSASGTKFTVAYQGQDYYISIPLIGKFNIYNASAAVAVALAEGFALDSIIKDLALVPQVAGRFELIDEGQDFKVVVDYAHTPDGLLNVLLAAKELNPRHLICVFGCGGDRDRTKRPIMGRIAAQKSDFVIVTSDNPRTEDPFAIIAEVEVGVKDADGRYLLEENRRAAIEAAIKMAQKDDLIMIAGKGHEDYQLVKGDILHFDDREVARELLKERLNHEQK